MASILTVSLTQTYNNQSTSTVILRVPTEIKIYINFKCLDMFVKDWQSSDSYSAASIDESKVLTIIAYFLCNEWKLVRSVANVQKTSSQIQKVFDFEKRMDSLPILSEVELMIKSFESYSGDLRMQSATAANVPTPAPTNSTPTYNKPLHSTASTTARPASTTKTFASSANATRPTSSLVEPQQLQSASTQAPLSSLSLGSSTSATNVSQTHVKSTSTASATITPFSDPSSMTASISTTATKRLPQASTSAPTSAPVQPTSTLKPASQVPTSLKISASTKGPTSQNSSSSNINVNDTAAFNTATSASSYQATQPRVTLSSLRPMSTTVPDSLKLEPSSQQQQQLQSQSPPVSGVTAPQQTAGLSSLAADLPSPPGSSNHVTPSNIKQLSASIGMINFGPAPVKKSPAVSNNTTPDSSNYSTPRPENDSTDTKPLRQTTENRATIAKGKRRAPASRNASHDVQASPLSRELFDLAAVCASLQESELVSSQAQTEPQSDLQP